MRRTSLGSVPGFSDEAWKKWVEQSLRSLERATHVNTAEQVSFSPSGSITSENTQDAIQELDGDVTELTGGYGDWSFAPSNTIVTGMVVEIQATAGSTGPYLVARADGSASTLSLHAIALNDGTTVDDIPIALQFGGVFTPATIDDGPMYPGQTLWASSNSGRVSVTPPRDFTDGRHVVGFALSSVEAFFRPGNPDAERHLKKMGGYGFPFVTQESLGAGYLVTIAASTNQLLRADAGAAGLPAHGFVETTYSSGATAQVFFHGINPFSRSSAGSTFSAGDSLYLSTDGGKVTNVIPATGNFNQFVGFCLSSQYMLFFPSGARDPGVVSS